ncbi:MAG: class I SAM-dependent methyltransferase [Patescibacteria group bacterium]
MYRMRTGRSERRDIRIVDKAASRKGAMLDVGCGSGLFVLAAKKEGWHVRGIDFSKKAVRHGQQKLGVEIECADLLTYLPERKFDVMAMRHIIEHTVDPASYIQRAAQLLEANGVLYIKTPNIASFAARFSRGVWEWMSPPAHLFFFSPATLRLLLEKNGFGVVSIKTRRGDAHSLLLTLLFAVLCRAGIIKGKRSSAAHGQEQSIRKRNYVLYRFVNAAGMLLIPIEYLLNIFKRGPELIAVARVKK